MHQPDIAAAERFLAETARVLDRRRFERLFRDGPAQPVLDAIAAYRNEDGGFGHALEPDGRGPGSQPVAVMLALETLDECDVWDEDLVAGACDYLERVAPAEGGATFVDPNIEGWPRAPWWQPDPGLPASLITTGNLAAVLHRRGVEHPWLDKADRVVWARIETLEDPHAYVVRGILHFLEHCPDRERAAAALDTLAPLVHERVELDPDAPGEVHGPLDFAPRPQSPARALFAAEVIERHLDHFARGQQPDGGWTFNWLAWSDAATAEWRGSLTVSALSLLRANGRIDAAALTRPA